MYNRSMTSGWRLILIPLLLFFIVITHNACSRLNSTTEFPSFPLTEINSVMSSRNQQDKIQFVGVDLPLLFVSFNRLKCHQKSVPEKTLRFETSTQKWQLTKTIALSSGDCNVQRTSIESVHLFKASQVAVFQDEHFKQFTPNPKESLDNENLAAICKPHRSDLDVGHSKLSGLTVLWNETLKIWQTRLDYSTILESDHLPNQGPYGIWSSEPSILVFQTGRTLAPESAGTPQRQRMILEISRFSDPSGLSSAVFNYSFRVYANDRHEIIDAPMHCWINRTRLD